MISIMKKQIKKNNGRVSRIFRFTKEQENQLIQMSQTMFGVKVSVQKLVEFLLFERSR